MLGKKVVISTGSIRRIDGTRGESIEEKIARIMEGNETTGQTVELYYQKGGEDTERRFDHRADKWDTMLADASKINNQISYAGYSKKIALKQEKEEGNVVELETNTGEPKKAN